MVKRLFFRDLQAKPTKVSFTRLIWALHLVVNNTGVSQHEAFALWTLLGLLVRVSLFVLRESFLIDQYWSFNQHV
jgi:hypothetical protein